MSYYMWLLGMALSSAPVGPINDDLPINPSQQAQWAIDTADAVFEKLVLKFKTNEDVESIQ